MFNDQCLKMLSFRIFQYNTVYLQPVIKELKRVGHQVRRMMNKDQSAVTAIFKTKEGLITAMSDLRQQGNISGY